MSNEILIIAGDPNSINSEIIYKSYKKLNSSLKKRIYIIGSYNLIKKQFNVLKYKIKLKKIKNLIKNNNDTALKILDLNLKFSNPFNVKKKLASNYILASLNFAHGLALKNKISGLINCPIDKSLLRKKNTGVTEYLARKCNIKNNSEVMLIFNKKQSVVPLTTHIEVKNISKKINSLNIINKLRTIKNWYETKMNFKPKIAILGLNPHNSEMTKNSEEKKIIVPAIKKLKRFGFNVNGPIVADSIFINEYKKYDVIVGMYHDQVLAPFKALYKYNAINITLGLKYLRLSPDHGTAFNLIKKKKANATSLLNCIKIINKIKK